MKKTDNSTISELLSLIKSQQVTLMTFDDAANYLKISRSTLYKLLKKIKHSKPNGKRIWFTKADLDNWALQNPSKTNEEIEAEAIKYVNRI